MMDARGKWMTQLAELCFAFYDTYKLGLSEHTAALEAIQAHARTTPEGFALVPVPEWVPVGERLPVVPNGEDYAEVWVVVRGEVREDAFGQQISEDGMSLECGSGFCSDGVTHWKYKYTPAPPEAS